MQILGYPHINDEVALTEKEQYFELQLSRVGVTHSGKPKSLLYRVREILYDRFHPKPPTTVALFILRDRGWKVNFDTCYNPSHG
jgi:hypothetical protein